MSPRLIALDWGTTRCRAYLVEEGGAILESRSEPLGILNIADGDFAGAFAAMTGPWLAARTDLPVIASGMIGSRQGWREAPYVACPAGAADIARRLISIEARDGCKLWLVPGLSCFGEDDVPDVMRGEEAQTIGSLQPGERTPGIYLLPGTHSKWVLVADERILRFATFMTGELFALLKDHGILGRLMRGETHDPAAFRRGLDRAGDAAGLLRSLFSVRTLGLFERLPAAGLASYLSGLLIGGELAEARRWIGSAAIERADVTIVGGEALAGLYGDALAAFGLSARLGPADAVVPGLLRIARHAGLLR